MDNSSGQPPSQPEVDSASGKKSRGAARRLFTKRFLFSVAGLSIATTALWTGKMDAVDWMISLAIVLAGHNTEDIVRAIRKP